MELEAIREHLVSRHGFPLDHDALVADLGQAAVETGTGGTETVAAVLARVGEDRYEKPEDVTLALAGGREAAAVGRLRYDDRAGAHFVENGRRPLSL